MKKKTLSFQRQMYRISACAACNQTTHDKPHTRTNALHTSQGKSCTRATLCRFCCTRRTHTHIGWWLRSVLRMSFASLEMQREGAKTALCKKHKSRSEQQHPTFPVWAFREFVENCPARLMKINVNTPECRSAPDCTVCVTARGAIVGSAGAV